MDGSALFEHKGLVDVTLPEADLESALAHPDNFNLDKFVDVAIEAGAEDVSLEPGEEQPYLCVRLAHCFLLLLLISFKFRVRVRVLLLFFLVSFRVRV